MTTFFIPHYSTKTLTQSLLEKQKKTVLFNTPITSFENWVRQQCPSTLSPLKVEFDFYNLLQDNVQDFPLYGPLFKAPHFCREIISFTKECLLYQIDFSTLPDTTAQEKELKECILLCAKQDHIEKYLANFQCPSSFDDRISYPSFFSSFYFFQLYQQAKENGLKEEVFPKASTLTYRKALNARQEIEGIVQEIINENLHAKEINLIVCDPSYFPLITHVFNHYQIPVSFTHHSQLDNFCEKFIAAIQFGIHQDLSTLTQLLNTHLFSEPFHPLAYQYHRRCILSLDEWIHFKPKFQQSDSTLFSSDFLQLQKMEEHFIQFHKAALHNVQSLLNQDNPQELLLAAFTLCANQAAAQNKNQSLYSLKQQVDDLFDSIQSMDDCLTLCHLLKKTISVSSLHPEAVAVTDLSSSVLPRKRSYIVGAHQKNYPNFSARSGIFDEHYVEKINFPSLQQRFDAHTDQLQWIFSSATECFFTYPSMDYQGKEFDAVKEIEDLVSSISFLPCILSNPSNLKHHSLTPFVASSLFLKEGRVFGSVSSFERYFSCPYSYFLSYGLRLKEMISPTLQSSTLGTIQHHILEKIVADNLLHSSTLDDTLSSFITSDFESLFKLYPNDREFLEVTKDRLFITLSNSLRILKMIDEKSLFTPSALEHHFEKELEDHPITLRGVIDRIDIFQDYLRIIDYKSSSKTLSETKVKAGVQLQLLCYLLIAKDEFSKDPSGAYYFSLKQETISLNPISIKNGECEENYPVSSLDPVIDAHRLSGWTMNWDAMDCSEFIKGGTYDFDAVESVIHELFDELVTVLNNGEIKLDPIDGACEFCPFKSICRFKGQAKKISALVLQDVPLKKKKGDEKHEMES